MIKYYKEWINFIEIKSKNTDDKKKKLVEIERIFWK